MKSDCNKRSRCGKQFNSRGRFAVFIPLLWDESVVFVWNSVCVCRMTAAGVFLCAFHHSKFRVKQAQVKIMIAMLLQLLRCAIGPNALSRLSGVRDMSLCPNCQWSTAHDMVPFGIRQKTESRNYKSTTTCVVPWFVDVGHHFLFRNELLLHCTCTIPHRLRKHFLAHLRRRITKRRC